MGSGVEKSGVGDELIPWRRAQAAMLYHFTSLDYLRALHKMVSDLIGGFVDPLLDMAKAQGRDNLLLSRVWGHRNLARNWENNAWPFLKDLQVSLARDIAWRTLNKYRPTSVNESLRGVAEYSTDWATPGEERFLEIALATISQYAASHDSSVEVHQNQWDDFSFAYVYPAFAQLMPKTPKFRVANEVIMETGKVPAQTGVYMSIDDPHASLQFVWSEHGGAKLRNANTFNEVGLAALATVGRQSLWFDADKMFAFATAEPYTTLFHDSVFLSGEPYPLLAPAAVARSAFKTRPCRWVLVDIIPGEFEELDLATEADAIDAPPPRRIVGGDRCREPGFYFTPSSPGTRRYFASDEVAPDIDSSYGATYWQWDANQEK